LPTFAAHSISTFIICSTKQLGVVGTVGFQAHHSPDFCTEDDFQMKLDSFREDIHNLTNLPLARRQHNHSVEFHWALVSDTALYSNEGFECADTAQVPGSKVNGPIRPPLRHGPFFPGYCSAALKAAIVSAKTATCTKRSVFAYESKSRLSSLSVAGAEKCVSMFRRLSTALGRRGR